jgi:integrase
MSPRVIEILRELEAERCAITPKALLDGPPNPQKKPKGRLFDQHPDAITKAMARACKAAQIEGLHFHDLRHEATSRLFENTDLDVMEIRAITGHKTMQMLARYSHLRMDRLADRLAGKLRG